jgi:hypothetical protein
MRKVTRFGAASLTLAVFGLVLLGHIDGRDKEDGDTKGSVEKIAEAHAKGDKAAAKTKAAALAKSIEEVGEVMDLMVLRKKDPDTGKIKGGFGVGDKPGDVIPDGIDRKLSGIARDGISQGKLDKEVKALKKMAYRTAAILEVALAKPPEKDEGKKTRKAWDTSATEARDAILELAKALDEKSPAATRKAAARAYDACEACHQIFKN